MKIKFVIFITIILTIAGCSHIGFKSNYALSNAEKTEILYNKFIENSTPNVAQLNLFFSQMPKGGDLHHHYSGSIYAESYLDWVEAADCRIDKNTFKIVKAADVRDGSCCLSVKQLRSNPELYRKLLTIWSDKDYKNHYHQQLPPDANFFNTFGYFGPIAKNYKEGLKILKAQAVKENVSYIETMLSSVEYSYQDSSFDENIRKAVRPEDLPPLFDGLILKIKADDNFTKKTGDFAAQIENAHRGIDDDRFLMRYQTYATRNGTPSAVFSALYAAFRANEKLNLLVGVNLVGPENGLVALSDYTIHMQMISYFRKIFPKVNLALHAGELTLGMVPPKDLNSHIDQAINIAGATRIGHGVDMPYEERGTDLLKQIKEKSVIEINFTSNEFILGVKDKEHPYMIYAAYDVPLVISTDDSGVSRNNLSSEYVLLATRYKPSYKTVKKYVYNSIKYSFLLGNEKALLIKSLDDRFDKFEAGMAQYSDLLLK
ncbi:MAG: adenosine deaminase [Smithellaceae bacterium]